MSKLPQNIFAFLVLAAALVIIILLKRPHSVCDSQADIFKSNQTPFLYIDEKKSQTKGRDLERFVSFCKHSNSAGGCLDFFEAMRRLYSDLEKVPSGCTVVLASQPEVQEAIFIGLELIVHLAWGESPPQSNFERNAWLDSSQLRVFCDFKKLVNLHLGSSRWADFVEKQMTELPGATLIPRNDAWGRTLLSDPCNAY